MQKKEKLQQFLVFVIALLAGVACGAVISAYLDLSATEGAACWTPLARLGWMLLGLVVGMYLHIIVHEGGHLIFGLLTGYGFSSFRIGSVMILKQNGKVVLRRLRLAGTGGQCLMTPPEIVDGRMPFVLYHLGGCICNLALSLVTLVLFLCFRDAAIFSALMLIFTLIGLLSALSNGIPLRVGMVDNDGKNALSLGKNPQALRAFWTQMKINEQSAQGVRLKNMPEEWFAVPDEAGMKNSMVAAIGVFACNRLMDRHCFQEADALMERLLTQQTAILGIHRGLLVCDRIFCELISQRRPERLDALMSKEQKRFMKSMKNFLTVLRTEYALTLLAEKNEWEASRILARFQKAAKSYPYAPDVEIERELIGILQAEAETV